MPVELRSTDEYQQLLLLKKLQREKLQRQSRIVEHVGFKVILLTQAFSLECVPKSFFFFLFLNQNICCGYSKEPSQGDGSFEHLKHMTKPMGNKIFTLLR